jgi:hypothetical protein
VIGFCPWACHAGFILPCWDLDGCRHALYRDHRQSCIQSTWKELKPLHYCHHISWFLFVSYSCEVLDIVVIFRWSSILPKADFGWKNLLRFWFSRFYRFISFREVKHLILGIYSFLGIWRFSSWTCRASCYLQNKHMFIEIEIYHHTHTKSPAPADALNYLVLV